MTPRAKNTSFLRRQAHPFSRHKPLPHDRRSEGGTGVARQSLNRWIRSLTGFELRKSRATLFLRALTPGHRLMSRHSVSRIVWRQSLDNDDSDNAVFLVNAVRHRKRPLDYHPNCAKTCLTAKHSVNTQRLVDCVGCGCSLPDGQWMRSRFQPVRPLPKASTRRCISCFMK